MHKKTKYKPKKHLKHIKNTFKKITDFDIAKRLGDTVETLHNVYAHWFKAGDQGIIDFMNSDN